MEIYTDTLPEELLIAVLHKVGTSVRLVNDVRLATIFNDAASQYGDDFEAFEWHPHYRYSPSLTEAFQVLDMGGSIVRENPGTIYFRVTPHTAGRFGQHLYDSLSEETRKHVDEVAERIRNTFGQGNELTR